MADVSFDRALLEQALSALGVEARAAGKTVDIAIYGGSCLLLTTDLRRVTKDVDVAIENDEAFLKEAAERIALRLGLPSDWLNDGVMTYLSPQDETARELFGSYPMEAEPGLRVYVPTPEYMLAMKLMAMRIDVASGAKDLHDIVDLTRLLGLQHREQLLDLAAAFYPEARVSGKLHLALDALWQEKERRDRGGSPAPTWKSRRGCG
jgi:hypothetical protein